MVDYSEAAVAARGDSELVAGVAAHQREAMQELYNRYFGVAYALAVRMLADSERAEECVQAVFLAFWQEPQSWDPASAGFSAWLLAAVHRTARAWQREASPGGVPLPFVQVGTTRQSFDRPAPDRRSAAHHLAVQQEHARAALAARHPAERATLEHAYFDGQTVAEIAASRKESPMTVQMRIRAGVQHLRAARARASQPHRAGTAANQSSDPAGPPRPVEGSPRVRALADETNPEYRATVRHAPLEQDVNGTEASTIDTRAEHKLDERQNQLLLTLGHELKTPITAIKGTVQLAHHRLRAAGHQQEAKWLEVANSQIDRLTALVDYLLRAGQLDGSEVHLDLARFNLADLIRDVAMTMQDLSQAHTLVVEAPEDVEVEGDVDRLRQVVNNLINNAIKYSPAGGNVEITLRRTGGEAAFCVRDYGIGIPLEERERVFERFERATNVGHIPGFGLGLTMCRDIVHAHHGHLWVGALSEEAAAAAITSGPPPAGDASGSLVCMALPVGQAARSRSHLHAIDPVV